MTAKDDVEGTEPSEPELETGVPAAALEQRRATRHRAIFLDVENTSKPQHLAHVLEHLAVDRRKSKTILVGVANWRVVGQESARFLSERGAQLLHSAPSVGVSDWTDLRIAVAAGLWLGTARPGDRIEIVSDDRAFDAVGDVAVGLGVEFRRLSYRRLTKERADETAVADRPDMPASRRSRRGRRGGDGAAPGSRATTPRESRRSERAVLVPSSPEPVRPAPTRRSQTRESVSTLGAPGGETAPHDALVSVVRELVAASPRAAVTLDTVAGALKNRGFQRLPGSLRLVTRLRRMREIRVSPLGVITLAHGSGSDRELDPSDFSA
jgi:hypothetical protein